MEFGNIVKPKLRLNDMLTSRETGLVSSSTFSDDFLTMKTSNMRKIKTEKYAGRQKIHDIKVLKGGEKSLYMISKNASGHIYEFSTLLSTDNFKRAFANPMDFELEDFCEISSVPHILLSISHGFGFGNWEIFERTRTVDTIHMIKHIVGVHSCCSNKFSKMFAVSCRSVVIVSQLLDDVVMNDICTVSLPGKAYSLDFDSMGHTLFCGLDSGTLLIKDLRSTLTIKDMKISEQRMKFIKLLDNENYIIVSGLPNVLRKVDLRMKKTVCDFHGHTENEGRRPFSLCQFRDLLCATGADNVTRFWSISSGQPLHAMKPELSDKFHSWIVSDDSTCYFYIFSHDKIVIYEI